MSETSITLERANMRWRDPVTALFAAALDGNWDAESALRELALDDDRASEAYLAIVGAAVAESLRHQSAAVDVASCDQVMAAVRDRATTGV